MALNINVFINEKGAEVFKNLKKDIGGLEGVLQKAGGALAAYFAVGAIKDFGVESVKAFDNSEASLRKLSVALGYSSSLLNNQASALQAVTRFEDDNITAMQATLATYKLSEEQIARLTPAILDMAAATGDDLSTTAEKAAKAITTKTNALAREGIELDKGIDKNEKLDSIVAQLTDRFDGQAQALAKVGSGSLVQVTNLFGDLQENIGRLIVQNPLFEGAIGIANKVLTKLIEVTQDVKYEFDDLDNLIDDQTLPAFLDLNEVMLAGMPITENYGTALASVKVAQLGSPEAIAAYKDEFTKFTAAASDNTMALNKNEEILKIKAKNAEIAKRRKAKDKKPIDEEVTTTTEVGFKDYTDREIDDIVAKYATETQTVTEYLQERAIQRLELTELEAEATNKEIEYFAYKYSEEKKYSDLSIVMARERQINNLNTIGTMLGAFAQLNSAMKGNAKLTQGLLIGETIMNTAAAIMKYQVNPGGLMGLGLSIAAGATGTAQVATIASQKFADGGWTPDYGTSRSDSIPAMLSKNERVVSAQETARAGGKAAIDAAISGGGRGGVTVMIEGSVIAHKDWIRDEFLPALEREGRR